MIKGQPQIVRTAPQRACAYSPRSHVGNALTITKSRAAQHGPLEELRVHSRICLLARLGPQPVKEGARGSAGPYKLRGLLMHADDTPFARMPAQPHQRRVHYMAHALAVSTAGDAMQL